MQQPPAEGDMDEMLTVEEIEARFARIGSSSLSRRPTISKGSWRARSFFMARITTRSTARRESCSSTESPFATLGPGRKTWSSSYKRLCFQPEAGTDSC